MEDESPWEAMITHTMPAGDNMAHLAEADQDVLRYLPEHAHVHDGVPVVRQHMALLELAKPHHLHCPSRQHGQHAHEQPPACMHTRKYQRTPMTENIPIQCTNCCLRLSLIASTAPHASMKIMRFNTPGLQPQMKCSSVVSVPYTVLVPGY